MNIIQNLRLPPLFLSSSFKVRKLKRVAPEDGFIPHIGSEWRCSLLFHEYVENRNSCIWQRKVKPTDQKEGINAWQGVGHYGEFSVLRQVCVQPLSKNSCRCTKFNYCNSDWIPLQWCCWLIFLSDFCRCLHLGCSQKCLPSNWNKHGQQEPRTWRETWTVHSF